MKRKLIIFGAAVVLLGVASVGSYHRSRHSHWHQDQSAIFYCPMHPSYTSNRPGNCPICSMKLIPAKDRQSPSIRGAALQPAQVPVKRIRHYRNPMNPEVTSSVAMKDEMGMDYIPVYEEIVGAGLQPVPASVEGRTAIILSNEKQQLIGVKTTVVTKQPLTHTVHASGRVAYDPDLYNALNEYQAARSALEKTQTSPWPDVRERGSALLRASALRLRQMGLSPSQIAAYTQNPQTSISLLLSQNGSVWVYAQIYEYEIGLVKIGQRVSISSAAYPGRVFNGIVRSLDPVLSSETRSLKVRIEVPNPAGDLKLEMYVDASIVMAMGQQLVIPRESVITTGRRTLVYVAHDGGRFEPRPVKLGRSSDQGMEVIGGVSENERVVVGANFLIDSESRIQGAVPK